MLIVGRFVARFGQIWVKWQLKLFAMSELFRVILVGAEILLISVTPDFFFFHSVPSTWSSNHLRSRLTFGDNISISVFCKKDY